MSTPAWWQTKTPKIILGLLFLLILCLFLFRQPLAYNVLQQFLNKHHAQLDCLEFNVDRALNINISRLCISHAQVSVVIEQAKWQRQANTLSIASVVITHQVNESQITAPGPASTFSPIDLTLPAGLPLSNISQVTIRSPLLRKELSLRLSQNTPLSLTITGDIQASLAVKSGKIRGAVEWSLADLSEYLRSAESLSSAYAQITKGEKLLKEQLITAFEFDGQVLSSNNQVAFSSPLAFERCPVRLSAKGNIKLVAQLREKSLFLDLSQVAIKAGLQGCEWLESIPEPLRPNNISLSQSSIIKLDEQGISSEAMLFSVAGRAQLSIKLAKLTYGFDGVSQVNYGLNFVHSTSEQPETLILSSAGHLSRDQQSFRLDAQQNSIQLTNLAYKNLHFKQAKAEFSLLYSQLEGVAGEGSLQSTNMQLGDMSLASLSSQFSLSGSTIDAIKLISNNQLVGMHYQQAQITDSPLQGPLLSAANQSSAEAATELRVKQLTLDLIFHVLDKEILTLSGKTLINELSADKLVPLKTITIKKVSLEHSAKFALNKRALVSEHHFVLNNEFSGRIEQTQNILKLFIAQQALKNLQTVVSPLLPELSINEGLISVDGSTNLDQGFSKVQFNLHNAKLVYDQYQVNELNLAGEFKLNSAGLQLPPSKVTLSSLDVGIPIKNIQSSLQVKDNRAKLSDIQGNILGGRFNIAQLWLDARAQQADISVNDIELAELVELQQQGGIDITGKVEGRLPLSFSPKGLSISAGLVSNQGPGTLRITDNPAFDSIKAQQAELAFLENINFEKLSSSVKLDSDGLMLLDFSLLGSNPEKKQSVNFNYSHQENIFTLLKSLRLANSVATKIQQKIDKGGGK